MEVKAEGVFFNSEVKTRFLNSIENNVLPATLAAYNRLFLDTAEIEGELGKDVSQFKTTEYIELFRRMQWNKTNTFSSKKYNIKSYCDWCNENLSEKNIGYRFIKEVKFEDLESDFFLLENIFGNPDDLFIIGETIASDRDLENKLLQFVPYYIIALLWYGLSLDDVISLKKDQVSEKEKTVFSASQGEKVSIYPKIFEGLVQYRDVEFSQITRNFYGYKINLKDSVYLFRSSHSFQLSMNSIKAYIKRLNIYMREHGYSKAISIGNMKLSYLFRSMYLYEMSNGVVKDSESFVEIAANIFKSDLAKANYFDLYKSFRASYKLS